MDSAVTEHGSQEGLRFLVRWDSAQGASNAAEATRGELQAWIGDTLVWGAEEGGEIRGLDWTWVELLEHVSATWRYLLWEEGNPLGLDVFPNELRTVAQQRWRELPAAERERQEVALYEYEESHNLAAGLHGMYPADLWVQREGACAWIISAGYRLRRPAGEVMEAVESLGDALLGRLQAVKSEARAATAMAAWRERAEIDASSFVTLATNLPPGVVEQLSGKLGVEQTWELGEELRDGEILAAARMIGTALPVDAIHRVITGIRKLPRHETPDLDTLSRRAGELFQRMWREAPYDQGTAMAGWAREQLGVPSDRRIDPEKVLKDWGVKIVEIDLGIASVDAIGCWGPDHGPAVFINRSGKRAQGRGRRATLAHEIGHLLMDRDSALPLAEVVGGRVPPAVEPRARAFAAELLVPKSVAATLADVPKKRLDDEVRSLCARYEASREILAWQAWNSGILFPTGHVAFLKTLVSEPWRMMRG